MKHMIIIITVISIIFGFSYWSYNQVSHSSRALLKQSSALESSIHNDLWNEAAEGYTKLKSTWDKTEHFWSLLLNHTEIDNIDMLLARIEQYIKTKQTGLVLAEISSLKWLIAHIPEKEKVNLTNVF